jgi:hypothetical protein
MNVVTQYPKNPLLLCLGAAAPSVASAILCSVVDVLLFDYALSMFQTEQKVNGFARVVLKAPHGASP